MTYENLLEEASANDIYIIEDADFVSKSAGLINGDVIGISKRVRTYRERACILAEELGHYHTTCGDIISQSSVSDRKQEAHARMWAYNRMVGLTGIVNAYKHGCHSLHEAAEYLNITEEFLSDAIRYYTEKYGTHVAIDNYVICFEPALGVFEAI